MNDERPEEPEHLSLRTGPSLRLVTETRSGSDPNSVTNGAQLRGSDESPREQGGSTESREQNVENHKFGEIGDSESRSPGDSREKQQSPTLLKSPVLQTLESCMRLSQEQNQNMQDALLKNVSRR